MIDISKELQSALTAKTQGERAAILSSCLKKRGVLDAPSTTTWKQLFELYYIPDVGEIKYYTEYISRVYIDYHTTPQYRHTVCFHLELSSGETNVVSSARLAGKNRTEIANRGRAMRSAIDDQITEWCKSHPLDTHEICPVAGIPLGSDAQVDHVPPFHILVKGWMQIISGVTWHRSKSQKSVYELDEPYKTSWQEYHRAHATLRYLSFEGNKIAHKGWGC